MTEIHCSHMETLFCEALHEEVEVGCRRFACGTTGISCGPSRSLLGISFR